MYLLLFFVFILAGLPAANAQAIITIGYLRLSGIDSRYTLAGYLTNLKRHNTANTIPGVQFALDVTTLDCADDDGCLSLLSTTTGQNMMAAFYAKIPTYAAIIRPCHIVAPQVIDQALLAGGIPVVDPVTIRAADFAASHVVSFNQNIRSEIARQFTFMQHEAGCAVSGILYDDFSEMSTHVQFTVDLFTDGNLPAPAVLAVDLASDIEVRNFVLRQDVLRKCFLVLATNKVYRRIMVALNSDPDFVPEQRRMYGTSLINADSFSVGGSNRYKAFAYTSFVRWNPGLDRSILTIALAIPSLVASWSAAAPATERALFTDYGQSVPTTALDSTFQGILVTSFIVESVRSALVRDKMNGTEAPLRIGKSMASYLYVESRTLSDFPFQKLYKSCPPKPMKQICWCNTVTCTSYMYKINVSTGVPYVVWDDEAAGQRDIASISMTGQCGYEVSGWSYPITGLFLYPQDFVAKSGLTATEVTDVFALTTRVFGEQIREINYSPVAPARPYRYAVLPISNTTDPDDVLQSATGNYNPFVVFGSMDDRISASSTLTLFPSIVDLDQSDPVLMTASKWQWQIINLRPVLADLIHALAGYYASNSNRFTGVYVITTSSAIAKLVSKSFATFGYDIPAGTMTVTMVEATWYRTISGWLGSSANPFVLVATARNPNFCVDAAYRAAVDVQAGTLAFATSESVFYAVYSNFTLDTNSNTSDIIFSTFMNEWWMLSTANVPAQLLNYTDNPRYHMASAAIEFTKRLGDSVSYDFTSSAADVLYQAQTVSTSVAIYGPFSNLTCTDEEVAANEPDRRCQCTKGVRSLYVHSAKNWQLQELSTRTNRYKYTMTTCGVKYSPYIPPPVFKEFPASSIAAIAAGVSCFVLAFIIGSFTINYYFFSRNNRAAPKDPTVPFAIVFTDIQSSTALWARAPAAMSEAVDQHHRLIRSVLRRNGGYEVKTVGDSFMVAFIDTDNATTFALETQIALNKAKWSSEIDAIYIELLAEAGIVDEMNRDEDVGKETYITGLDTQSQNTVNSVMIHVPEKVQMKVIPSGGAISNTNENLNLRNRASTVKAPPSIIGTSTIASEMRSTHSSNSNIYRNTKKASNPWHGVRVRIGVHYGMGDIRKDPVSLGYDYYGTVVNTAARVEGVGHGGQVLLTDAAYDSLNPTYIRDNKVAAIALGPQPLRGLDAPIKLFQFVPASLEARRFPPLRLHIEKETDDASDLNSTSTDNTTGSAKETAEELAARVCSGKQYKHVSTNDLLLHYYFLLSLFGPTTDSYKNTVIGKLGESWGFESAVNAARHEKSRLRLLIGLLAKVTKAFNISSGNAKGGRRSTGSYHNTINSNASSNSLVQLAARQQPAGQSPLHSDRVEPIIANITGKQRVNVPSFTTSGRQISPVTALDSTPREAGGDLFLMSSVAGSAASMIKDTVLTISRGPPPLGNIQPVTAAHDHQSINNEEDSFLLESVIRSDSAANNHISTPGSLYRRARELSRSAGGPLH